MIPCAPSLLPPCPLESLRLGWGGSLRTWGSGLEARDLPREAWSELLCPAGPRFFLSSGKQTGSHTEAFAPKSFQRPLDAQVPLGARAGGLGVRTGRGASPTWSPPPSKTCQEGSSESLPPWRQQLKGETVLGAERWGLWGHEPEGLKRESIKMCWYLDTSFTCWSLGC